MKKALTTLAILTVAAISARADIISAWDVSTHGSPADATLNASTTSLLSNTPALGRVTVLASAAGNSFNSNTWNLTNTFAQATNYINFTITAGASAITLTDLQFSMNGSNTGPRNGVWGYSTDGGTSFVLGDGTGLAGFGTGGNPQTPFTITGSLADWDFTDFNVASGNSVEFRFWAFGTQGIGTGASAAAGSTRIANITGNDLVLNGIATVVPEPTTIGLIGLGLAGVVAFARRRKA